MQKKIVRVLDVLWDPKIHTDSRTPRVTCGDSLMRKCHFVSNFLPHILMGAKVRE